MHKVKVAIIATASALATLTLVVACGGGPTVAKAASTCGQYEVKLRKGQIDQGSEAIKLASGWEPFATDGKVLFMRRCVK